MKGFFEHLMNEGQNKDTSSKITEGITRGARTKLVDKVDVRGEKAAEAFGRDGIIDSVDRLLSSRPLETPKAVIVITCFGAPEKSSPGEIAYEVQSSIASGDPNAIRSILNVLVAPGGIIEQLKDRL